jgi:hypothetical protein
MSETNDFIFRGVDEAKYKMFNSAQREWLSKNYAQDEYDNIHYDAFIINKIQKAKEWNNGTILNLFKTYKISEYDSLAFLAFLQHYQIPTPLLDFTSDPLNALYFAVEKINYVTESPNEIDNYFSIYCNYQNNSSFEIFYDVYLKNKSNVEKNVLDYEYLTLNNILLITDRYEEFKILNNIRIANQKGLFIYHNNPRESLESQYKDFIIYFEKEIGEKKFKELLMHDTIAICFNIHKKYAKHIKNRLSEMGVTNDYIFPKIEMLMEYIVK